MHVRVLGSGAGGGFPQWNCNCRNCAFCRRGDAGFEPRTQSSIAISADGRRWILVNASPDVRAQILAFEALQPRQGVRGSGIEAIVLADSQIDHTAGLLMLRESNVPLVVHATRQVRRDLTEFFPVLALLEHYCGVEWHEISTDGEQLRIGSNDALSFRAVPLAGKAPPYSPRRASEEAGSTIALLVEDRRTSRRLLYAPGIQRVDERLVEVMAGVDCLLVDGTVWTDDEMVRTGAGTKPASAMGHLQLSGHGGLLDVLSRLSRPRKILVHINNTNPILDERSPEREELRRSDVEVAHDGMGFEL